MSEKQWYALYTRSKWEKKVARLLEKKNIASYCPLNRVMQQWADRKKMVLKPLFSSYVFVHASPQQHIAIKQTDGVLNFVYWLGKPAVIIDQEIQAIKDFVRDHTDVVLQSFPVNIHDKVRITDGPLMQLEGNILEVLHKTVKVYLPSLGSVMIAEIPRNKLEIVQRSKRESVSNKSSIMSGLAS